MDGTLFHSLLKSTVCQISCVCMILKVFFFKLSVVNAIKKTCLESISLIAKVVWNVKSRDGVGITFYIVT